MRLDKKKNTKRNIVSGFLNKFVTLICPFLIRTIIIRELGSEYLGLNSLFSSILQVLNLSELGFGSAVVYSMYKPIAEENHAAICALLRFYHKIYFYIGCGVLSIGLLIMPFMKYLISGEVPEGVNIYILYLFYLINTSISYFLYAYKASLLVAHQRQDIISNTLTITQGGMYILQIFVLMFTKNYYLYLIMMPIFTILNNLLNAIKVNKLYPEYKCMGNIEKRELDTIKHQVPGLMINKLCYISRNTFDSIFISAFLGLKVSAMYGNYYYIMNAIIAVLSIISNSLLAGIGNSQVTDSVEENYLTMNKMNFIYMWISGLCTICLLCLYQPFMNIWVGDDLTFKFEVVVLFCVYFYVMEMGVIRGLYSDAAGLWWENRYRAIVESIANIILNFVLIQVWGICGIILATLISLLLINFCWGSQIVFRYYFKNNKQKEYFVQHAKYAITTLIVAILTYGLCNLVDVDGGRCVLFRGIICLVVPNALYYIFYFKTKEYKIAIPWLLRMMGISKEKKSK